MGEERDDYQVTFTDPLLFTPFPLAPTRDVRDPYGDYAKSLARGAVHETVDAMNPEVKAFYVYGQEGCARVLRDDASFSARALRVLFEPTMGKHIMGTMDEPDHSRYRMLVAPAFSPRMMSHWENTIARPVIHDMIEGFADSGCIDLVASFTFTYPARVIAGMMGLDKTDFRDFFHWASDVLCIVHDREKAIDAGEKLKNLFARELNKRRNRPGDDLVSILASTTIDGRKLDDEEIFSFLRFLLPAGIETTYRTTGSYLFHLLENPDQMALLHEAPDLIANGFEETLRMEPPLPYIIRVAVRDTELFGVPVPEGSMVYAVVPSAGRDPSVVSDPDRFDLRRQRQRHMAFGYGTHICLGMHLARMEVRVAIATLLQRLPNLRWNKEKVAEVDAHMHGAAFRAPTALPVVWDTD